MARARVECDRFVAVAVAEVDDAGGDGWSRVDALWSV